MVSKTRERLIEVARQLFVRNGVETTTMLDIANASEKGRRTIYTYFKNKREIHQAVIDRESEQIVSRQRQIQTSSVSATAKLEDFMRARFEILRCPTSHKPHEAISLMNLLEGNRVGKARRLAAQKEVEILHEIIREGIDSGEFDPDQARHLAPMVVMIMQGVDNTVAPENIEVLGFSREETFNHVIEFVINGIRRR
ncbi:MAG: TetR/AcrR family transcriptional regulator [Muribaculaceae bacterium]|nr:TetR/AcrR family transcriptional regulator [Muribaculaceae bacterium]